MRKRFWIFSLLAVMLCALLPVSAQAASKWKRVRFDFGGTVKVAGIRFKYNPAKYITGTYNLTNVKCTASKGGKSVTLIDGQFAHTSVNAVTNGNLVYYGRSAGESQNGMSLYVANIKNGTNTCLASYSNSVDVIGWRKGKVYFTTFEGAKQRNVVKTVSAGGKISTAWKPDGDITIMRGKYVINEAGKHFTLYDVAKKKKVKKVKSDGILGATDKYIYYIQNQKLHGDPYTSSDISADIMRAKINGTHKKCLKRGARFTKYPELKKGKLVYKDKNGKTYKF